MELEDLRRAIGCGEAALLLRGRGGRPACMASVRRWADPDRGCKLPGGVVVLQSVRLNGELLFLIEWVAEFEAERIRLAVRPRTVSLARSPRARKAGHRRAEEALTKAGVGGGEEVAPKA